MSYHVFTYQELEALHIDFMHKTISLDPGLKTMFHLLSLYGFRYTEVYEVNRWTDFDQLNYNVDTAKNSNDRLIPKNTVPENYKRMITEETEKFDLCRYSTVARWFNYLFQYNDISVGNKEVSTHFFRYFSMKEKDSLGWSTQEIADYFGEVELNNVVNYVNASMYTTFF